MFEEGKKKGLYLLANWFMFLPEVPNPYMAASTTNDQFGVWYVHGVGLIWEVYCEKVATRWKGVPHLDSAVPAASKQQP